MTGRTVTDFDVILDRRESSATKWNSADLLKYFGTDDLLPFWVADMEFSAPPTVCSRLIERAQNGVFGYEYKPDNLYEAIISWYSTRHQWDLQRSEICFCRGIMNAVASLITLFSEEGDGIIIQPPVFMEFRSAIRDNNRIVVRNPLQWNGTRYQIDFDDLEVKARDPRAKMLILCNPHNPVGRVWTRDELRRVGQICRANQVLVISDEIYGDFVFSENKYTPFASISDEDAQSSFTCFSPAKTFNIAAVTEAVVVIPHHEHRKQYQHFTKRFSINATRAFSVIAMESAYRTADAWLDQLLGYLQGNVDHLRKSLQEEIPSVMLVEPEGTFLAWLDFRKLGMEPKQLEHFLAHNAKLALNSGHWFGREGAGYARMTIACRRSMLQNALTRLKRAVNGLSMQKDG